MSISRYDRQVSVFGADGQRRIAATKYTIVGLGGTGSHVAQQLAYLGGMHYCLIDGDHVEETNLNRVVTAHPADVGAKLPKVEAATRLIQLLQPTAAVVEVPCSFVSEEGFAAIREADVVFGCVDRDGARLILNEVCQAYHVPYVDIATGIDRDNPREFGGRVHISLDGERCIYCDGLLDQDEIRWDLSTDGQRRSEEEIYGVRRSELGNSGPSVVALNGILASAAVMEFMAELTGLRAAKRILHYRGFWGTLSTSTDPPAPRCPYCKGIRRSSDHGDLMRWVQEGFGSRV